MAGDFNIKVSRGGRFFNPGSLSLFSIGDFRDLTSALSYRLFTDEDNNLLNEVGNIVGQLNEDGSCPQYGEIDFDGDYERYYTNNIEDASDDEIYLFCSLIIDENEYIEDEYIIEYLIENQHIQQYIDYDTSRDKDEIIEELWKTVYTPYGDYKWIPKNLIKKLLEYYSDEYSDFYEQLKEDWL